MALVRLDTELAAGLGDRAALALSEVAEMTQRHYEHVRWLVNGRSRAVVAVVIESQDIPRKTRKLVLKSPVIDEGDIATAEFPRHHSAISEAPGDFAENHLCAPVNDPIRVGDGSWITFQEIAGKDIDAGEVLTVLLNRMLDRPGTRGDPDVEPHCDPGQFAAVCGQVVGGIMRDWVVDPLVAKPPMTVKDFLGRHVLDQMEPGGRLHHWSLEHPEDWVTVDGTADPLPNPLALCRGAFYGDKAFVRALVGRAHGDLHTDNVLVRVRPEIDGTAYHLIDTALYESDGPLTRDPVHLILYIIARSMDAISPLQQEALIKALVDPSPAPNHRLPGWLDLIVREIDRAALEWLTESGLQTEWREQWLLSLAGCSLLFLGRTSTRRQDLDWFLRLGAIAARRYMKLCPPASQSDHSATRTSELPATSSTWAGWLCQDLPDLLPVAKALNCVLEVEALRDHALRGDDRSQDYQELLRKVGGPSPLTRYGARGTEGTPVLEVYLCPLSLCDRREARTAGKAPLTCHLPRSGPQTMRQSFEA